MLKHFYQLAVQKLRLVKHRRAFVGQPYFIGRGVKLATNCYIEEKVELYDKVVVLGNVRVGGYTSINKSTVIASGQVGRYCSIGQDCIIGGGGHDMEAVSTSQLMTNLMCTDISSGAPEFNYDPYTNPPLIGNDVWIAAKSIILQGVKIGNGAVIASGSVVTKDVPPYAIVAGTPAKIIRYRFEKDVIDHLENWKWWEKGVHEFSQQERAMLLSGNRWQSSVSG